MREVAVSIVPSVSPTAFAELFQQCFNRKIDAAYCSWKFDQNPAGTPIRVVAEDRGYLVGSVNFIPVRMLLDGTEVTACQSVDTMVHPEYRRHGLFSQMTELAMSEMQNRRWAFKFNFPGEQSLPGYLKLGHHRLFDLEYWVCVRPSAVARWLLRKALGQTYVETTAASATTAFSERFDELWSSTVPSDGVCQIRDRCYLHWRYERRPDRNYRVITESDASALYGYVITRGANVVDLWAARCSDLGLRLLSSGLRQTNRSNEPVSHLWLSPGAVPAETLRHLGFRRSDQVPMAGRLGLYPVQPVVLFCPNDKLRQRLSVCRWYLTMGDTDWM